MWWAGPVGLTALSTLIVVQWTHHVSPRVVAGTVISAQVVRTPALHIPADYDSPAGVIQAAVVVNVSVVFATRWASSIADVQRLRQVRIARIGGLHGP